MSISSSSLFPNNLHTQFVPLQEKFSFFERVYLYDSINYFYLVGCDELRTAHRIIKINRLVEKPTSIAEIIEIDSNVYDEDDLEVWLASVDLTNRSTGGVTLVGSGFGIVGFVKFLKCYYLIMITEIKKVGNIYGNWIYAIKSTEIFPMTKREETGETIGQKLLYNINKRVGGVKNKTASDEARYMGLFQLVDCTKDFFFSYTYDLTQSFQHNYVKSVKIEKDTSLNSDLNRLRRKIGMNSFQTRFMWNYYHLEELHRVLDKKSFNYSWIMPIIHGAFEQKRFDCLMGYLDLIVIARRSRFFAGTRYLKRGLNVHGDVANHVEVEQIVQWEQGRKRNASSLLQFRGSIPTYWSQEVNALDPMPPINIFRRDTKYIASQIHFSDVIRRYGSPIICLDLVKHKEKKEREMKIGADYRDCVEELNFPLAFKDHIRYIGLDYTSISRQEKKTGGGKDKDIKVVSTGVVAVTTANEQDEEKENVERNSAKLYMCLEEIVDYSLYETAFFCSTLENVDKIDLIEPRHIISAKENGYLSQNGAMRTNCVDCLDRTNGGQFALAKVFLTRGLQALGIKDALNVQKNDNDNMLDHISVVMTDLFASVGNSIAQQYGGSLAHNKLDVVTKEKKTKAKKSKKNSTIMTSVLRYYSNTFTDNVKQDAINIFLGLYRPYNEHIGDFFLKIWELPSDSSLHNHDLTARERDDYYLGHYDMMAEAKRFLLFLVESKYNLDQLMSAKVNNYVSNGVLKKFDPLRMKHRAMARKLKDNEKQITSVKKVVVGEIKNAVGVEGGEGGGGGGEGNVNLKFSTVAAIFTRIRNKPSAQVSEDASFKDYVDMIVDDSEGSDSANAMNREKRDEILDFYKFFRSYAKEKGRADFVEFDYLIDRWQYLDLQKFELYREANKIKKYFANSSGRISHSQQLVRSEVRSLVKDLLFTSMLTADEEWLAEAIQEYKAKVFVKLDDMQYSAQFKITNKQVDKDKRLSLRINNVRESKKWSSVSNYDNYTYNDLDGNILTYDLYYRCHNPFDLTYFDDLLTDNFELPIPLFIDESSSSIDGDQDDSESRKLSLLSSSSLKEADFTNISITNVSNYLSAEEEESSNFMPSTHILNLTDDATRREYDATLASSRNAPRTSDLTLFNVSGEEEEDEDDDDGDDDEDKYVAQEMINNNRYWSQKGHISSRLLDAERLYSGDSETFTFSSGVHSNIYDPLYTSASMTTTANKKRGLSNAEIDTMRLASHASDVAMEVARRISMSQDGSGSGGAEVDNSSNTNNYLINDSNDYGYESNSNRLSIDVTSDDYINSYIHQRVSERMRSSDVTPELFHKTFLDNLHNGSWPTLDGDHNAISEDFSIKMLDGPRESFSFKRQDGLVRSRNIPDDSSSVLSVDKSSKKQGHKILPDMMYFRGMSFEESQREKYRKLTKRKSDKSQTSSKKFGSFLLEKAKYVLGISDSGSGGGRSGKKGKSMRRSISKRLSTSINNATSTDDILAGNHDFFPGNFGKNNSNEQENSVINMSIYQRYEDVFNNNLLLVANNEEFESFCQNKSFQAPGFSFYPSPLDKDYLTRDGVSSSSPQKSKNFSNRIKTVTFSYAEHANLFDNARFNKARDDIKQDDEVAFNDYSFFLGEVDIPVDDVTGMEVLSMCAHVTTTMLCEEFDGLSHLDSAGLATSILFNSLNHAEYELVRNCAIDDCVISIDSNNFKSIIKNSTLPDHPLVVAVDSDDDDESIAREAIKAHRYMATLKAYTSFSNEGKVAGKMGKVDGEICPMGLRSRRKDRLALFPLPDKNYIRDKKSKYLHTPLRRARINDPAGGSNNSFSGAGGGKFATVETDDILKLHAVHGLHIKYAQFFTNSFNVPNSVKTRISNLSARLGKDSGSESLKKWAELQTSNIVLRYLFEQVAFTSEISFFKLIKRLSSLTSENMILLYCSGIHIEAVAADLQSIAYSVSDMNENSNIWPQLLRLFNLLKDKSISFNSRQNEFLKYIEDGNTDQFFPSSLESDLESEMLLEVKEIESKPSLPAAVTTKGAVQKQTQNSKSVASSSGVGVVGLGVTTADAKARALQRLGNKRCTCVMGDSCPHRYKNCFLRKVVGDSVRKAVILPESVGGDVGSLDATGGVGNKNRNENVSYSTFPHGPFNSEEDYISKSRLKRCDSKVDYYDFKLMSDSGLYERVDNPFFVMNEASVFFFSKFKSIKYSN